MKKIIIIGSSIAGASAACMLAKYCDVVVYEKKAKKDIGKKVCANVVTPSFLKYAKMIGLNPKKYVIHRFSKAKGFSENNEVEFKTEEFRLDREKLVDDLIKLAEKNGARFEFNAEFKDVRNEYISEHPKNLKGFFGFKKRKRGYIIKLRKNNRLFEDSCDILVGADGALSNVAKKAGLWNNRKMFLVMHTEIPFSKVKKLGINKKTYYIYFGKKAGYYSYIFPYKNRVVIGAGDEIDKAKKRHKDFLKFIGIKGGKIKAALIPEPKVIPWKKDLFLIGDAGCNVKFSGGGIVPSMIAALALKEAIVDNSYKRIKNLNKRTLVNRIGTKLIKKWNDKEFDSILEILKQKKFKDIVMRRDEFNKSDYLKILDLKLLKFLLRIF